MQKDCIITATEPTMSIFDSYAQTCGTFIIIYYLHIVNENTRGDVKSVDVSRFFYPDSL